MVASVSQWYVRCTDRYVEIVGRRSAAHGRASGLLRAKGGDWHGTWPSARPGRSS